MTEQQLVDGPTGHRLSWADGHATFPAGHSGHRQLLTFSVVVTAELAEVTASYQHPNGEPLFDLGQRPPPPAG